MLRTMQLCECGVCVLGRRRKTILWQVPLSPFSQLATDHEAGSVARRARRAPSEWERHEDGPRDARWGLVGWAVRGVELGSVAACAAYESAANVIRPLPATG